VSDQASSAACVLVPDPDDPKHVVTEGFSPTLVVCVVSLKRLTAVTALRALYVNVSLKLVGRRDVSLWCGRRVIAYGLGAAKAVVTLVTRPPASRA